MKKALVVFTFFLISFTIQSQTTLYNFPFENTSTTPNQVYLPTSPSFNSNGIVVDYNMNGVNANCANANGSDCLATTSWNSDDYLLFTSSTLGASDLSFKFCFRKNNTDNFSVIMPQITLNPANAGDWFDLSLSSLSPSTSFFQFTSIDIPSTYENKSNVYIRILKISEPANENVALLVDNVTLQANCSTPYLQTTGIGITNGPGTSLDITCSRGNGSHLLVVARAGAPVNASPSNGTSYSVGAQIGENYVVYNGTANSFNISTFNNSALNSGTTYHFAFYEFNPNLFPSNCPRYFLPATTASQTSLPIELTHFTATPVSAGIALAWSTASEVNNAYVAVEHSTDGSRYDEINRVPGQGDSFEPRDYNYTDKTPEKGVNYYRLRQVDFDGTESYSPVVNAQFGKTGKLSLYPSPAVERLNVTLSETDGEPVRWDIYDASGRLVQSGTEEADVPGFPVELAGLPEGVYTLQVFVGREVMTERFLKK